MKFAVALGIAAAAGISAAQDTNVCDVPCPAPATSAHPDLNAGASCRVRDVFNPAAIICREAFSEADCAEGTTYCETTRYGDEYPAIATENGNIIMVVGPDGRTGYRIGSQTVYLDDVEPALRAYTDATAETLSLGYRLGVNDGGQNQILEYLKDDLSGRVNALDALVNDGVTSTLTHASSTQTHQASTLTHAVETSIESTVSDLKIVNCTAHGLAYNPKDMVCCPSEFHEWVPDEEECLILQTGLSQDAPAESCKEVYDGPQGGQEGRLTSGLFWIKIDNSPARQLECGMKDFDYPGAALMLRGVGHHVRPEQFTGERELPCHRDKGSSYCKQSDTYINKYKEKSDSSNPYISVAYRQNNKQISCRGYMRKGCRWSTSGAPQHGDICSNGHRRDGSRGYCQRNQHTSCYRGIDGHHCPNGRNYNSDTDFPRRDGVPQNSGRAFIIFEHCGGTHYCGGWDTSWHHKELWIL